MVSALTWLNIGCILAKDRFFWGLIGLFFLVYWFWVVAGLNFLFGVFWMFSWKVKIKLFLSICPDAEVSYGATIKGLVLRAFCVYAGLLSGYFTLMGLFALWTNISCCWWWFIDFLIGDNCAWLNALIAPVPCVGVVFIYWIAGAFVWGVIFLTRSVLM
jgi:hypothetical protein